VTGGSGGTGARGPRDEAAQRSLDGLWPLRSLVQERQALVRLGLLRRGTGLGVGALGLVAHERLRVAALGVRRLVVRRLRLLSISVHRSSSRMIRQHEPCAWTSPGGRDRSACPGASALSCAISSQRAHRCPTTWRWLHAVLCVTNAAAVMRDAPSGTCSTACVEETVPPRNTLSPTIPSLPTRPTSTAGPPSIGVSSDTTQPRGSRRASRAHAPRTGRRRVVSGTPRDGSRERDRAAQACPVAIDWSRDAVDDRVGVRKIGSLRVIRV
jgi:hypothetical protein